MELSPDRPRVAVIYHFLPNYRQGVFDALASSLEFDITFITGHDRPGQEAVPEADNLDPVEVKNRFLAGRFLWQQGLLNHLREADYDALVILGNWMWPSSWAAAIWQGRMRGVPILWWTHGWLETESGLQGRLRRLFYRQGDKLLLYGNRAAEIARGYGWKDSDVVVVGNSLPLPSQTGQNTTWDRSEFADPDLPVVIWTARLIPDKRPEMVIEAASIAQERGTPVNVVFVGDGASDGSPGIEELRQLAEATIPGRTLFTGAVHDETTLASYFAEAAVAAVPNAGGLSIPHALIHGVPVVANDDPSSNFPEYEFLTLSGSGRNGSVFAAGDASAFADELIRWTYDEPLGEVGRRLVSDQVRIDASPTLGAERILDAVRDSLDAR